MTDEDDKELVWNRLKNGINHWPRWSDNSDWREEMLAYSETDAVRIFKLNYLGEWKVEDGDS